MPSRVTPNKASMSSDHEMLSTISIQSPRNDVIIVEHSISEGTIEVYSPTLKLMKCFGIYSEHKSLKQLANAYGRQGKLVPRIYRAEVLTGFWLNFTMSFADIFFWNNIYLFTMFSLWSLLITLRATICWIILCAPLRDSRKSRFENFLRILLAININANLDLFGRSLSASFLMKPLLTPGGWQEEKCVLKCSFWLVMSSYVKDRCISKSIAFVNASIQENDFFVWYIFKLWICWSDGVWACSMNSFFPSVFHKENTSSIYLLHSSGLSVLLSMIYVSIAAINRLAKDTTILVPLTVPRIRRV